MEDPFDQFLNNLYSNYVHDAPTFFQGETASSAFVFNPSISSFGTESGTLPASSVFPRLKEEYLKSEPSSNSSAQENPPNHSEKPNLKPSNGEDQSHIKGLPSKTKSQTPSIPNHSSPQPTQSCQNSPLLRPSAPTIKSNSLAQQDHQMSSQSDSSPDTVESPESELSSTSETPPQTAMREILDLISWDDTDCFRPSKRKRESNNRDAIKKKHNLAEQKRRVEMNDAIDCIRLLLPNGTQKSKATKLAILIEAFDYFKRIQQLCCDMVSRNKTLEDQLKAYQKLYPPPPSLRTSALPSSPKSESPGLSQLASSSDHPLSTLSCVESLKQTLSSQHPPSSATTLHSLPAFNQIQPSANKTTIQQINNLLNSRNLTTSQGSRENFISDAMVMSHLNIGTLRSQIPQLTVPKISNAVFYAICVFSILLFSPLNLRASLGPSFDESSRSLLSESTMSPSIPFSSSFLSAPQLTLDLCLWISVVALLCFIFILSVLGIFCLTIHWSPIWYLSREKRQSLHEEIERGEIYLSQGKHKDAETHFCRSLRYMGLAIPESDFLLGLCFVYQLIKRLLQILSIGLILEKWVMNLKKRRYLKANDDPTRVKKIGKEESYLEEEKEREKEIEIRETLMLMTKAYKGLLSQYKQKVNLRYLYIATCGVNSSESSQDYRSLATIYAKISFALFSMNTNSSSTIAQFLATYFQYRAWKVSSSLSLTTPPSTLSDFSSPMCDPSSMLKTPPGSVSDQHLGQLYFVQGVSRLLSCRLKESKFHLTRAFQLYSLKNTRTNSQQTSSASTILLPQTSYESDQRYARICALTIGLLGECEGNTDLSLSSYSYSLHSSTQNNDPKTTVWSLMGLSRVYLQLNKSQISLQMLTEIMKSNDLRLVLSASDLFIYFVLMSSCLQKLEHYEQSLSLCRQAVLKRKESNDDSSFWVTLVQPILSTTLVALLETAASTDDLMDQPQNSGEEDSDIKSDEKKAQTRPVDEDIKEREISQLKKQISEICELIEEVLGMVQKSAQNSPLIKTQRLRLKAHYYYLLAVIEEQEERKKVKHIQLEKERKEKEEAKQREREINQEMKRREEEAILQLETERELQIILLDADNDGTNNFSHSGDVFSAVNHAISSPISIPRSTSSPNPSRFTPVSFSPTPPRSPVLRKENQPPTPEPRQRRLEREFDLQKSKESSSVQVAPNRPLLIKAKKIWWKALQLARSLSWEHEEQLIVNQVSQYSLSVDH